MRSTLFTWCFIDYWLPAAERGVENRDNGALLLVGLLQGIICGSHDEPGM